MRKQFHDLRSQMLDHIKKIEDKFNDDRNKLKEKISELQDKLRDLKILNSENDKLKTKIKELVPFKENVSIMIILLLVLNLEINKLRT